MSGNGPVSSSARSAAQTPADLALTELSGLELARRIRAQELTSREVVEAHIERLAITEPRVHGVVATRYDEARAAADTADARIAAAAPDEVLPPLLGVPCTIKESIAVEGMPHTAGFRPAAHRVADRDATAVTCLLEAGAIPLGVTNTSSSASGSRRATRCTATPTTPTTWAAPSAARPVAREP